MNKQARKIVMALLVALTIGFSLEAQAVGRYDDLNQIMVQMIDATENLGKAMELAATAFDVALAVNAYADSMESLQPRFKTAMEKYPELRDAAEPPAELQLVVDRMNKLGETLGASMTKLTAYANDPDVVAAVTRLSQLKWE